MKISIQLFAVAKELAGRDAVEVELPSGATVADLRQALVAGAPALSGILAQLKFAIDEDYAAEQTPLREGAKVACIPPVSGG